MHIHKAALVTAGIALIAFAVIALFQRKVMPIPVVGAYLPR